MTARCVLLVAAISTLTLAACSESTAPVQRIEDGIGEGAERLLSDAELLTPTDANPAAVPSTWTSWINANANPIRSLTSSRFDDLEFLKSVIGNRRLVQLGESGHGVREFDISKVRLIKFLHEQMGFDVIAFESGLYECWSTDQHVADLAAVDMMRNCIFGVWNTSEVLPLFDYIKLTRSTNHPLYLAGIDTQISSMRDTTAAATLSAEVAVSDPVYAARVKQLEQTFFREYVRIASIELTAQQWRDSIGATIARNHFIAAYDSVVDFFRTHANGSGAQRLVARQTATTRAQFLRQLVSPLTNNDGFEIRDLGMANNIDFLMDELYPGKKMMVWAHNAHIEHDLAATIPVGFVESEPRNMGLWVSQRRRAELYTIGLFMYTGTAANNSRRVYTIARPLDNSLEALFYQPRKRWLFVDMLSAQASTGTDWMTSTIFAKEWGVNDYKMIMKNQFDGIVFIHTVSPPSYM